MNAFPTDSNFLQAADFVPWLVEMGADEVLLEQPVNRLLAPPVVDNPVAAPSPVTQLLPSQPKRQTAPKTALKQDAAAMAAGCNTIDDILQALTGFDDHPLKKTATRLCFLGGAAQSRILLLCDKPRSEEDRSGEVLAAKHQALAERMLAAIGLSAFEAHDGYEHISLASFIPWRPPGNRAVLPLEVELLLPLIRRYLEIAAPKLILCFGALPGQYLGSGEEAITRSRGKWLSVSNIPMLTTFHPETLLKSPQSKRLAWRDLQAFREKM